MAINIPQVSEAELNDFYDDHFSDGAVESFHTQFLQPKQAQTSHEAEEHHYDGLADDDDGLGYYPDGVKRTLTDEQIAIFRHSEIEALGRARDKQTSSFPSTSTPKNVNTQSPRSTSSREPRDIIKDTTLDLATTSTSSRVKKSKSKNKQRRREPKPDLRKRTWDVVQPGLDSLEYD